jgi:hypothetical protein
VIPVIHTPYLWGSSVSGCGYNRYDRLQLKLRPVLSEEFFVAMPRPRDSATEKATARERERERLLNIKMSRTPIEGSPVPGCFEVGNAVTYPQL